MNTAATFTPSPDTQATPAERDTMVSVVVRAYNEERWLPQVLAAIQRQRYREFEILVVDSGSTDRTCAIAEEFGARIVSLRKEDFTFGLSLNMGIRAARGRYIAIVSAHAIPTDELWLERLIAPFTDETTAMVFGGQRGHAVSKFSEARDFERTFPAMAQAIDDEHYFVNNANSAIRRDLWEEHQFDEGLPGLEDIEWAQYWMERRGRTVRYQPDASILHVHTESWAQVENRFYREGIAGRWVGVRIIRHIPAVILRECGWYLADLIGSLGQQGWRRVAGEITRYRYHKTRGTVRGIIASRTLARRRPALAQSHAATT